FKLIEAPRPELHDLSVDAAEQANRLAELTDRAAELRQQLRSALSRPAPSASAAVDPETAARLAALGYVGGGHAPPSSGAPRRDPKDGVHLMPRINRGMSAARVDPPLAIREMTAVLAEDPGLPMARRTIAV